MTRKGPGGPVASNLPPSKPPRYSSRRLWSQGFLVRAVDGADRVAFLRRDTAERIAIEAERITGIVMRVFVEINQGVNQDAGTELWCYAPVEREETAP